MNKLLQLAVGAATASIVGVLMNIVGLAPTGLVMPIVLSSLAIDAVLVAAALIDFKSVTVVLDGTRQTSLRRMRYRHAVDHLQAAKFSTQA